MFPTKSHAAGRRFVGALKLSAGRMCGDGRLRRQGRMDQVMGALGGALAHLRPTWGRAPQPAPVDLERTGFAAIAPARAVGRDAKV